MQARLQAVHLMSASKKGVSAHQIHRSIGEFRRLEHTCEIEQVAGIYFAIAAVPVAIVRILIGVVHTRAIAGVRPAHVIPDAMGHSVVPANIET